MSEIPKSALSDKLNIFELRDLYENSPCWQLMGMEIVRAADGKATVEFLIKEEHLNSLNLCHGGVVTTIADAAMGVAMRTSGRGGVTIEININLIRPVFPGSVIMGVGEVLHRGKKSVVCECSIYIKETGKLCGSARGTFLLPDIKK